jgi:hypothetical protein
MMSLFKKILPSLRSLLFFAIVPSMARAETPKLPPPTDGLGGTLQDFIGMLISILQAVLIPFLVVCIIYAGYQLVTAGDNEQQVTKAKGWIIWTLVGAAIILGAQTIADMVFGTAEIFK